VEAGAGLGFSVWTAARSLNLVVVTLTVQNMMVVMTPVMWKETLVFLLELVTVMGKETLVFLLELVTVMVAEKGNLVMVTLTVQNRMVVMTSVMVKLVADLLSLKWRENWGGTPAFLPWLLEERILKHSCTWLGLRGNRCRICLP